MFIYQYLHITNNFLDLISLIMIVLSSIYRVRMLELSCQENVCDGLVEK